MIQTLWFGNDLMMKSLMNTMILSWCTTIGNEEWFTTDMLRVFDDTNRTASHLLIHCFHFFVRWVSDSNHWTSNSCCNFIWWTQLFITNLAFLTSHLVKLFLFLAKLCILYHLFDELLFFGRVVSSRCCFVRLGI